MSLTSRERVKLAIGHKQPDRVPVMDSVWGATEKKWREQGLPEAISAADFLEFDLVVFSPDISLQFPRKIITEDEEYVTYQDENGAIKRDHKDFTSTPAILKTIIQAPDDWKKYKSRLVPNPSRVNWDEELKRFQRESQRGRYIVYGVATGYDWAQHLINSEQLLFYILSEPELVIDIYQTQANLCLRMFDMMRERGFKFDGALLYCDLGYRQGLLFSPKHYLEQLHPVFTEMCAYFHSFGLQTILHSCGGVKELVPYFIKAGFDCLNPLEVKAGMNLLELKQEFGDQLAFFGGIDARLFESNDLQLIETTLRQTLPLVNKNGGYIFSSDHSIPTDVEFSTFKLAVHLARAGTRQ
ncbi:MAG: hypothetical protein N2246_05625 [Candidatus Sumerlaeia bacterium]|nr:hypothetical protein [Candidatus Sumerlaeia bacterium]